MEILWSYEHEIALKWLKFTNKAICFLAGIGLLKASTDPNQPELIAVGSFIGFMKLLKCLVRSMADKITTYTLRLQCCMFSSWFFHSFLSLQSVQEDRSKSSQTELVFPLIIAELLQCCWAHPSNENVSFVWQFDFQQSPNLSSSSLVAQRARPMEAGRSWSVCVAHSCQCEDPTFRCPPSLF